MRFVILCLVTVCLSLFCQCTLATVELSLNEAILLAVRTNPNVQSSMLSETIQKFNIHVQEWELSPQFSLQTSGTYSHTGSDGQSVNGVSVYSVQPAMTLQTAYGTQLSLSAPIANTGTFNSGLSLQIMQPLLRGFGKPIVESALNDAKDNDIISKLTIESSLRNTVSNVINAYLDVISAEKTIEIDKDALSRANISVEQTKIFIKAGHKAGNELMTVESNVANEKLQLIRDENNLEETRYALLTSIGIEPSTDIKLKPLDINQLQDKYERPTLLNVKKLVLSNDIQYQIDQITLHGPMSRSLLSATDNSRWQLNLAMNAATGHGFNNDQSSFVSGLFNGTNRSQSVSLTLNIPIDDQASKQSILTAKVALKQAELALLQEKWSKETSAINGWNLVVSADRGLEYAKAVEGLQKKTYDVSYQKYLHGLIDGLELQSAQTQLIQSQQALLASQMNYIKSLVNLDLITGKTLKTWGIQSRS